MKLSKSSDSKENWEKKYFSLLDEHDLAERSYRQDEQLLCKTVTRLALATTGFNGALDPYLSRLRKLLKNGLKDEKTKQELEAFTEVLLSMDSDDAASAKDPSLLFEFLGRQYPKRKPALAQLERDYKHRGGRRQELLLALHELIDEEQSVVTEIHPHPLDAESIREQLVHLLTDTELPAHLVPETESILERLHSDDDDLMPLLEQTFALLSSMKKFLQSEQSDMTQFLTHVHQELFELGQHVTTASESRSQNAYQDRINRQAIAEEMQYLQQETADATELQALKKLVQDRLSSIATQIKQQQQQEQQDTQKHLQAFQTLLTKIKSLETESTSLRESLETAQRQVLRDPLTKLPNRLAYQERLTVELAKMRRNRSPLTLAIWDVDFFKKINDTYGHKAGDKTLLIIARLLLNNSRESDFLARYGGEEFLMLFPDTDAKSAKVVAEKLRQIISTSGFNYSGHKITVTVSCGISEFAPDESAETVFKRADQALYQAKDNGRNQCVTA